MTAVHPLPRPRFHARRALLFAGAALACATFLATPGRGTTPAWPAAADLAERLRQALPAGYTVQPLTSTEGLPAGWQSTAATAVYLQVGDGRQTVSICVVPRDWVGVQAKGRQADMVRRGPTAKVILPAGTDLARIPWLATLAPEDASLASAEGTTGDYAGQYREVEAEIRTLVRKGKTTRDQAVASFIALGVPAEDLIRDAALDTRSPARLAAIRALRHFPGKATREALAKIIADRSRDGAADTCRLAAIDTCQALLLDIHGPAVVAALQAEKDEAVAARLAAELNRLRFAPAAPELRRWLKQAQSIETKVACARALATLRDTAAAAEIRAAIDAPAPKRAAVTPSADAAGRRQLALELHRLAGAWGTEVRGSRLSLVVESPDRVVAYVENLGAGPLHFIPFLTASGQPWPVGLEITLDGEAISPPGPGAADIGRASEVAREVAAGTTATFELQVIRPLSTQGEHTLSATWFDLTANTLIVRAGTVAAASTP
ncbi:MAG: hypothetical protein IAE82_18600 [Opitutaceae bacterium]|nr:hypothetical protein [Opitutaceae bacterium]